MKISLLNICKNEMKFLPTYLEKNKDVDYICLLDTGSTDGTWEYLQEQAQLNPKMIIQQKIYEDFRFDTAKNDALKLLPIDTDVIVMLDLDEHFNEDNWVEILRNQLVIDGKKHFWITAYLDFAKDTPTEYPTMTTMFKIFTPGFKWYACVHEILSEADKPFLGISSECESRMDNLLVIHTPDVSKSREFYINLLYKRLEEILPVEYDHKALELDCYVYFLLDYYKKGEYEEGIALFNKHFANDPLFYFCFASYMYMMTNDVIYLRNGIKQLKDNYYNDYLLYFALKDDFEWCRQYKEDILTTLQRYDNDMPINYREYDTFRSLIYEMANKL